MVQLIKQMLTVDPQKRATTTDILKNAWFRVDLPAHLFAPLTQNISDAAVNVHAINEASEVSIYKSRKHFALRISCILQYINSRALSTVYLLLESQNQFHAVAPRKKLNFSTILWLSTF